MQDTNLVGFSVKDGWKQIDDFLLQKMTELNNDELSYFDCLKECGYEIDPLYDFSRSEDCPYFLRVYMTLTPGYPPFFVQMSITPEMETENFVCADGLSLMELLAKLAPIVQLKLDCTKPTQSLHLVSQVPLAEPTKPKQGAWEWVRNVYILTLISCGLIFLLQKII